jgi:hypothetical protein
MAGSPKQIQIILNIWKNNNLVERSARRDAKEWMIVQAKESKKKWLSR